ncbi:exopolyphosphatase [Acidovorax sp. HDW3]|uniref:exopolyphosphatase n=1 Tax=Acidovorax sp. HDW3 TaxID=2714923 RepID=UPI00140AE639|nr:exopolyphosphatase [Acidovorax sp. HDW3]QIL44134.1 exopolyphosphatase [Acidovorax sp. HDW3]
MQDGTLLAAVDLGSNSFRLEIARYEHGQLQRIEYLKETVRQGGGLDAERNLSADALQRGWDCLARFAERLRDFAPAQVRAVATQTLREARNRDVFIERGSAILGHRIEVVSGPEEARLIYQGVSHLLPQSDERRLVLDIGGRSTELILGQQYQAQEVASFRVGSVSWSAQFFADGQFTERAFARAETAAQAQLDEALAVYQRQRWDCAYGASGTVGAVGEILAASGHAPGRITRQHLDGLYQQLLRAGHASRVQLPGLKEERRAVIGGGLSVLRALFALLQIDTLHVAQGALRQGALYDLIERDSPATDQRRATVSALQQRFGVDTAQAERVAQAASTLFAQATGQEQPGHAQELTWAAQLHEVGCRIAHSGYHRHGAYILDNTDAAGFAQHELQRLALLVRAHRGKLRKLELPWSAPLALQLACLRLAVALCHARRPPELAGLHLRQDPGHITLRLPTDWATRYPQSAHLLREESQDWQRTPWALEVIAQSA